MATVPLETFGRPVPDALALMKAAEFLRGLETCEAAGPRRLEVLRYERPYAARLPLRQPGTAFMSAQRPRSPDQLDSGPA